MANLAGSATGFKNAFEKYVSKNVNWTRSLKFTMEKAGPIWASSGKMIKRMSKGASLTIYSKTIYMKKFPGDRSSTKYVQCRVGTKTGFIKANLIRKPTSKKNVLEKEQAAIASFNKALKTIGFPVTIKVKKTSGSGHYTFENIVKCVNVSGTPKADFALQNALKKDVCWISHKAAGGAKSFQQYSGVSKQSGQNINGHKEVQEFMQLVTGFITDEKLQNPMMMRVRSSLLKNYAIYGPKYKLAFSKDNCQLIGQGLPILTQDKKDENCYHLTWEDGHHTNGDVKMKGGYSVYLGATYRRGRGFDYGGERWRGARIMILPKALMEGRVDVIDI